VKSRATDLTNEFKINFDPFWDKVWTMSIKTLMALGAWLSGIASASGTEDHRFKSRQGEKDFRALYVHGKAFICNLICIAIVFNAMK
jgi:hypothetical protein